MFFFSLLLIFSGLQMVSSQEIDPDFSESNMTYHDSQDVPDDTDRKNSDLVNTNQDNGEIKEREPAVFNNDPDSLSYSDTKNQISLLKVRLRSELEQNRIAIDSVKQIFSDRLANAIIPHWYGTVWSFGGHTSVPKKGKIACGYFVSTTLKDMGLKLDRYKLARKSPIDEAKAISCGTKITTIAHEDPEQALAEIKGHIDKGIYFIGFDTGHVGFLVKKKGRLFLVHSNYLTPVSVCIEPLETAKIFRTFNKFHLVDISHNDKLIQKWLNNEQLF